MKTGVLLMTYGSATTAEHVPEYMAHIFPNGVPPHAIENFQERYRLIGHSPLIEITAQQAAKLNERLGGEYVVRSAMRHSAPFIADAVQECRAAGAVRLIGIILSPQFSATIMDGYRTDFFAAAKEASYVESSMRIAEPWPTEHHFISLIAQNVAASRTSLVSQDSPIIFTTHSMPQRVIDKDPGYLDQLKATTDAVLAEMERQGTPIGEWYSAYQSAGHSPEPWLKPDLTDILAQLKEKGRTEVLIVPIQFVADHLEVLYDLDIAAKRQCTDFGIAYHRTSLPNTDPLFIESLATTVTHDFESPTQE